MTNAPSENQQYTSAEFRQQQTGKIWEIPTDERTQQMGKFHPLENIYE